MNHNDERIMNEQAQKIQELQELLEAYSAVRYPTLAQENERLRAENVRLREALDFYAQTDDGGGRARQVLAGTEREG